MYEFDTIHYFAKTYNTLDLDFELNQQIGLSCTKDKLNCIVTKIQKCPNLINDVKVTEGNKKGYHLRFYCSISCDKCRIVFDDFIRYSIDQTRKEPFRNIIFDTKTGY